jgi:hypothetical protein
MNNKFIYVTDANTGDKIYIVKDPIMSCKLATPKFLHNDNMNFTINTTTSVMLTFCLN